VQYISEGWIFLVDAIRLLWVGGNEGPVWRAEFVICMFGLGGRAPSGRPSLMTIIGGFLMDTVWAFLFGALRRDVGPRRCLVFKKPRVLCHSQLKLVRFRGLFDLSSPYCHIDDSGYGGCSIVFAIAGCSG
jgi:hypothetical protein